jgi:hypothetical protein
VELGDRLGVLGAHRLDQPPALLGGHLVRGPNLGNPTAGSLGNTSADILACASGVGGFGR